MSMRLLYISVLGSDMYNAHILGLLQEAAAPDTEVVVCSLEGVPKSPFMPPVHQFYNQLLQTVIDAEQQGFDGVVIGCSSDPGLEDAKKARQHSRDRAVRGLRAHRARLRPHDDHRHAATRSTLGRLEQSPTVSVRISRRFAKANFDHPDPELSHAPPRRGRGRAVARS